MLIVVVFFDRCPLIVCVLNVCCLSSWLLFAICVVLVGVCCLVGGFVVCWLLLVGLCFLCCVDVVCLCLWIAVCDLLVVVCSLVYLFRSLLFTVWWLLVVGCGFVFVVCLLF